MKLLKRYLILTICLFISALYFNILQFPNKIVTGGIGGLSIIINNYFNIEPSQIILFISFFLLIIGTILLGINKISGAIISSVIYPIFIDITKNINTYLNINISNMLIISIILGVLFGITTGTIYRIGFSNGGLAILSEIISKYLKISLSKTIFSINFLIVIIGCFSINIEMILYSGIILLINSYIISLILKKKSI